jgi:predicted nucleic acid-binding protein
MIHCDTNFLVRASVTGSSEALKLRHWLESNKELAISAVAWMEFLNGPAAPDQITEFKRILVGGIIPFGTSEASLASFLFNQTGRRRASKIDCMIAATAIHASAALATCDISDFKNFAFAGLNLV